MKRSTAGASFRDSTVISVMTEISDRIETDVKRRCSFGRQRSSLLRDAPCASSFSPSPLLLSGCLARTAVDIVTLPVKVVGAGVDAVTTSQAEADQRRGREIREEEERRGREARRREREERRERGTSGGAGEDERRKR